MPVPTQADYINTFYGMFTPWEEDDFSAQVAEYFEQPGPVEIMAQPHYLGGDVTLDGDVSFGVSVDMSGCMPDAVASMVISDDGEPKIIQLQGIGDRAERLVKKWPFMLVGIVEEAARRNEVSSVAIQPAELNFWCPRPTDDEAKDSVRRNGQSQEEVIRGFQIRYNGTAKRAGYKKDADGLYRKNLS